MPLKRYRVLPVRTSVSLAINRALERAVAGVAILRMLKGSLSISNRSINNVRCRQVNVTSSTCLRHCWLRHSDTTGYRRLAVNTGLLGTDINRLYHWLCLPPKWFQSITPETFEYLIGICFIQFFVGNRLRKLLAMYTISFPFLWKRPVIREAKIYSRL